MPSLNDAHISKANDPPAFVNNMEGSSDAVPALVMDQNGAIQHHFKSPDLVSALSCHLDQPTIKATMISFKTMLKVTVITASCIAPLSMANAAEKVRLLLDWAYQGPQALFTYAADQGYFSQEGIDISVDRGFGSADAVVKLASGAYDIAFGDINSMMEFNVKNPDKRTIIAVMMLYDRAPLCVVSLDPSIKSVKDLEGKQLVTTRGAADLNLFPIFARNAGIDSSSIKFMYVTPNLREPILVKHQADAATAFYHSSYISFKALGVDMSKLRVFMYSDYGVELYGNAVMTSKAYAESKPEVVKAFNRALARAVRDVVKSPEIAIPSIKKRDGTTDEAVELERLKIFIEQSIATPYVLKNGFGDIDKARMERAIGQVNEALELPRRPTMDEAFDARFLPSAGERTLR